MVEDLHTLQIVILAENLQTDRARGNQRRDAVLAEKLRIVAHHPAGRIGFAGELERPAAADAALPVGPPDLLTRRLEETLHGLQRTGREQGHATGKVAHLAFARGAVQTGQIDVAALVGEVADPVARIEAQRIEINAHGTSLGAASAHEAVVSRLAAQHAVAAVAKEVDRLHGIDTQNALQLAGIDTDAAARAGLDLEMVVGALLLARAQAVMAEEDQRNLREDMHVAREGQRHEESPEAGGVEPPGRRFEIHQRQQADMCRKPFTEASGQETAAPVEGAGRTFGQQTGREDEPQGRKGQPVAPDVFRRTAQAQHPRTQPLEPRQRHARKDEEQQQVHQKVEDGLVFEARGEVFEEDMRLQGDVAEAQVGNRLDPSHGDEQEPAEGQRHVHVSEQRIDAEDPAMQQRLADDLPEGRQGVARGKPAQDPQLVGMRKLPEPRPPLPRKGEEHHGGTDYEGYAERSKEIHRQRSPSLRLMSSTTPRVLMPRGQTRRHLPQSMHLFISS